MKILLIHSGNAVNGNSHRYTFVKEQGDALAALGCEVDYFAIMGHGLKGYKSNIRPLREKIAEFQPDVVHAHYGLCGWIAAKALRRAWLVPHVGKPKLVVTFHSGETHDKKVNLLSSFFSLRADHVVYVAEHIRERVYFRPNRRHTSIIPCGVTMQDMVFTPYAEAREKLGWKSPQEKRYILFGGAFSNKRKNYPFLQKAEMVLHRSGALGRDIEVVEMRGFSREECMLRMCACDVFCLPTFAEGSPQVLKEAMAVGTPCVATDIADIKMLLGIMDGHYIIRNHSRHSKTFWRGGRGSTQELATKLTRAVAFGDERLAAAPDAPRTDGRERILALGLSNEQVAKRLMEIYKKI